MCLINKTVIIICFLFIFIAGEEGLDSIVTAIKSATVYKTSVKFNKPS